ncbi:MAG: filamentous hemagglutinin N-terminal domain-containing protein, partial [Acidobacteriota bacterium]
MARYVKAIIIFIFMLVAAPGLTGNDAAANPKGGTVTAGSATIIEQSATRLNVIQHSDRAAIDWRSFSIAPGEQTRFQQPSSTSIILNRVTGSQASQINGSLSANGQVLLVNPNGVLVGRSANIDVTGLALSTAGIRNDDFMAGRMNFSQAAPPGSTVVNQGQITIADTGFAALMAPGVANSGVITARLGKVSLGAGRTFTLDFNGDGLLKVAVDGAVLERVLGLDGKQLDALVSNTGRISADGGVIQLTAQAVRDLAQATIHQAG